MFLYSRDPKIRIYNKLNYINHKENTKHYRGLTIQILLFFILITKRNETSTSKEVINDKCHQK